MNKKQFLEILMGEGLLKHQAESVWFGIPGNVKKNDLREVKVRITTRGIIAKNWLLKLQRNQKKKKNE